MFKRRKVKVAEALDIPKLSLLDLKIIEMALIEKRGALSEGLFSYNNSILAAPSYSRMHVLGEINRTISKVEELIRLKEEEYVNVLVSRATELI